jgi:hypothetical protein
MLNGILHQRLNREQGNGGVENRVIDLDLGAQFWTQPELLNFQIRPDYFQLLFDFDKSAIRTKKVPKYVGQIQDQPPGLGIASLDGSIERIQRIEKEVGIDLCLKRP